MEKQYIQKDKFGVFYFKDAKKTIRHRTDGPAVKWTEGSKLWYFDDNLHRIDGPAVERDDGLKEWYIAGKLHRKDGPAVEWRNGDKEWWINGVRYSKEDFDKKILAEA